MMNIPTITMPAEVAQEALAQYREVVNSGRATKEDRAVMLGYQTLAKGRSLLNLFDAFRMTGLDSQGRPKLAVARADAMHSFFNSRSGGELITFSSSRWGRGRGISRIELAREALPDIKPFTRCVAVVPLIPPSIRPQNNLADYRVLWEADWRNVPGDPFLLKRIVGQLHVILAVWDLTPLERAVLRGRLGDTER